MGYLLQNLDIDRYPAGYPFPLWGTSWDDRGENMTPETIGLIVLGFTTLLGLAGSWDKIFNKPVDDVREDSHEKEKQFMKELHTAQIENLKYQKKIVEELSKLNGVLSVQGTRVATIEDELKEVKSDVKDLNVKVAVLENKD